MRRAAANASRPSRAAGLSAIGFLRVAFRVARNHPVRIFANEKCQRRDARRDHAANRIARFAERRRMRREAPPADRAGEAKIIENFGIVIGNAAREDLRFPGIRGRFEALKLLEDFERAVFAEQPRIRRHVLPAQQPAHELRRVHRLDLLAQSAERQLVNAREHAAVAPFDFAARFAGECAAQDRAARFHAQNRFFDVARRDAEQFAQRCSRRRAARCAIQPVRHSKQRVFARRR